jgi:hypothetical protein
VLASLRTIHLRMSGYTNLPTSVAIGNRILHADSITKGAVPLGSSGWYPRRSLVSCIVFSSDVGFECFLGTVVAGVDVVGFGG